MATAEECRTALDSLIARIAEMDARDREAHLLDRTLSVRVPDANVTFVSRLGRHGADPVRLDDGGTPTAQVRFTADSDVIVAIAADPGTFMRAWLSGRLRIHASVFDLLHLRHLM